MRTSPTLRRNPLLPTLPPQMSGPKGEWPHLSNVPRPPNQLPQGSLVSGLKDGQACSPLHPPSRPRQVSCCVWLRGEGTPRGWGGGSSAVAVLLIDYPRPHPITTQPLPSPPAWLACASPRPWGPGIRLESRFRECHLPPLMVLIIGTGGRAGAEAQRRILD